MWVEPGCTGGGSGGWKRSWERRPAWMLLIPPRASSLTKKFVDSDRDSDFGSATEGRRKPGFLGIQPDSFSWRGCHTYFLNFK